MPSSSLLPTLLNQFQSRYPMGCLCAELLTVHEGHYVVRALVQLAGTTLATGMAAAPEIEAAEDRAKLRALEAIGIGSSAGSLPQPVSGAFLPPPLDANSPKSVASTPNQPLSQFHQPQETSFAKTNSIPTEPVATQPTQPVNSSVSATPPLDILKERVPYASQVASNDQEHFFDDSELPLVPATSSTSSTRSAAAVADNELTETIASPVEKAADRHIGSEIKIPGTSRATKTDSKTEKTSKRKSDSFELPPLSPPQNPSDRSEEIMKIGIEMKRLGWSTEQGREYLKRTYGKRSRQELDDAELLDFLHYLEGQPSPLQTPF